MKKRLWSMFCALALLLTLIPATAFADQSVMAIAIFTNAKCGITIADPTVQFPLGGAKKTDMSVVLDEDTAVPKTNLLGNTFNLYQYGKSYTLTMELTADPGYYFDSDPAKTAVTIDGNPAESSMLQIGGDGKLTVTYSYFAPLKVITVADPNTAGSVTVTPEVPVPGETMTISAEVNDPICWEVDKDNITGSLGGLYPIAIDKENLTFTMTESDATITVPFKPIKYRISFDMNGHGEQVADQVIDIGDKAKAETPSCEDWDFGGWFTDAACTSGNEFDFNKPVDQTRTLYAKWTTDPIVSFYMNGHGEQVESQQVEPGKTATEVTPSCPGWIFGGWFKDKECTSGNEFSFTQSIVEDITLFAKWTEDTTANNYPIWVGGNQLNDKYPTYGSDVDVFGDQTVLYTPESGGKEAKLTLSGASIIDNVLDPSDSHAIKVRQNLTVVLSGENQIGAEPADFTSGAGFTAFSGIWAGTLSDDSNQYNVTLTGDGSLTIYDKYRGITAKSITIDIGGTLKVREYGDPDLACCLKAEDGSVVLNSGTLDLESHLSNGVAGALTVNGGTLEAYAHNTGGDAALNALDTEPTIPKDYEIIGGEDKDSAAAITTAEATSKKYVKIAKAIPEYTIQFETNGGSLILSVKVKEGETISKPADPTKEGYDFKGWYSDKELKTPYAFSTPVQGDLTLYADWAKKQYTVSFDSKGGSDVASQTVAYGDKAVEPKNPTRKGYKFEGWYTDKNCKGNKYSFDTPVKQDTKLYAKWTSKNGGKDADSKKAKTGDTSNVKVWIIVAVVAVVILAILAIILGRKKRD